MHPIISIIVPIYNEEENLPELHRRVSEAMATAELPYEMVLVNDGSRDGSLAFMRELHARDPRVKYLSLSRNFGHQVAISAGLDHACGDAVVVMDADLQDPPEMIASLAARWRDGYDVVYAIRQDREGMPRWRRLVYRAFYRLLSRLSRVDMPADSGDFRLMSRRVVDHLTRMPERNRFVRGLTAWVGFPQSGVPYVRPPRHAGTPKYSWARLWRLALDGLLSFSFMPLQLATWVGFAVAGIGAVYAVYIVHARVFTDTPPAGWTSLMVALLFLGGVQLMTLGIIGEYIGRIFDEVKRRPLYLLDETGGFEEGRERPGG